MNTILSKSPQITVFLFDSLQTHCRTFTATRNISVIFLPTVLAQEHVIFIWFREMYGYSLS